MQNRENSTLLLSVRPQFAERIYDGRKTLEIRKVAPAVIPGTMVLMYESGNQRKITGWFELDDITWYEPSKLWQNFGAQTGLEESEFNAYCDEHKKVAALRIARYGRFAAPIGLNELRQVVPNFMPPQNFRYLRSLPATFLEAIRKLFRPAQLEFANSL